MLRKEHVIKVAGGERALARLLGISFQAVNAWGDTVPELRVYKLKELKPRWFRSGGPLAGKQK